MKNNTLKDTKSFYLKFTTNEKEDENMFYFFHNSEAYCGDPWK
jgi:hypothetical protein